MADLNNRNDMNEFDEDDDRVFEFIDEDGTTTLFEHLATIEYQGDLYLVLTTPENEVEENTEEEIDITVKAVKETVEYLRGFSPVAMVDGVAVRRSGNSY